MNRQLYQYHPNIGYTFIPGLKTRVEHDGGGYLLRTNSMGFRSEREFEASKPEGTFRVLVFGDSFTAADGVSNKHRYTDVMETMEPGLEVYNFGLSGTGTDQQFLAYRTFGTGIEHDLIVLSVLVENIRRVASRYRTYKNQKGEEVVFAKPYFEIGPDGSLVLHHDPVPREQMGEDDLPKDERDFVDRGGRFAMLRATVNRLGVRDLAQRALRYQPLPEYDSPDSPPWVLMRRIIEAWAAASTAPMVVMPIPLYQHVEQTASAANYLRRFREMGQATGIRIHDPLPDYLAVPKKDRRAFRFEHDIHPTPASHRVLAGSLVRSVREFMEVKA